MKDGSPTGSILWFQELGPKIGPEKNLLVNSLGVSHVSIKQFQGILRGLSFPLFPCEGWENPTQ